jgi:AcrR family transcriptional regulator
MVGRARQHDSDERIVAAALALFDQRGFDQVTMEEIAAAADVSRRTVYRKFPTKGHVVLAVPQRWLRAWDDAVGALRQGRPLEAAEAGCRAVAGYIDYHQWEVLTAYGALSDSPTLESAGTINRQWIARIVALLEREPKPVGVAMQHVIAGAYLGAIDAMMVQWVSSGGAGSVLTETEAVLERLRPVWHASP